MNTITNRPITSRPTTTQPTATQPRSTAGTLTGGDDDDGNRSNGVRAAVLATLVALGLLIGLTAVPASAVNVDTDTVKLTSQQLDFGENWFLGAPLNAGTVDWDVTNGIVTPDLEGRIYINNASGTCARMQLAYYDSAHRWIATRSGGTVCATDGSLHSWRVDLSPFGSADVTHVHVRLQVQTGSSYSTVRWQGVFLG